MSLLNKFKRATMRNPAFEIAFRDAMREKELKTETIKQTICCGEEWNYTEVDWSIAKCHKCGKPFNE